MPMLEQLIARREEILAVAQEHGGYNVRVVGSVARGEDDEDSDIDILVDMEKGRSLLDLGGLLMDLRELLDRTVHVATEEGLRKRTRDRVMKDAISLSAMTPSAVMKREASTGRSGAMAVRPAIEFDREQLATLCRSNHIRKLSVFGSALRDDFGPDSDVDLLVEFDPGAVVTLLDMARMEIELTEMVGRQVDLRTPQELSRYFRDKVLATAVVQYAA